MTAAVRLETRSDGAACQVSVDEWEARIQLADNLDLEKIHVR